MKGFENHVYLIAYIISNVLALVLLYISFKWVKAARFLFFGVFAWASWVNWTTVINDPQAYLDYAQLAFLPFYTRFINGWFSQHIKETIGFIATAEALIAVSFWFKGWIYKTGILGAIIFLIAIAPLGIGAAFPCTLILAVALGLLLKDQYQYLLTRKDNNVPMAAD